MNTERHLLAIRHESSSLASAAREALDTPVPSCPDWTVADLVAHVTHGFGVVARIVRDHADAEVSFDESPPRAGGIVEAFEEAAAELVEALTNEAPDSPAWNWSRRDETVAWWARRMAHELAVHRWDVSAAVGSPSPIEADLAVDGVDELLNVFLPHTLAERPVDGLGGTFSVTASDTGDAWFGRLTPETSEVVRGVPASLPDARLRGTASDLMLGLWGRPGAMTAEGDERIVALLT